MLRVVTSGSLPLKFLTIERTNSSDSEEGETYFFRAGLGPGLSFGRLVARMRMVVRVLWTRVGMWTRFGVGVRCREGEGNGRVVEEVSLVILIG